MWNLPMYMMFPYTDRQSLRRQLPSKYHHFDSLTVKLDEENAKLPDKLQESV